MIRWLLSGLAGIAAAFLFQTCVQNTGEEEDPIDPGRMSLTNANIDETMTSLAWSNDNSKVYYTGPAGLNVVTLGANNVANLVAGTAASALIHSQDGSTLYYLTVPGTGGFASLRSISAMGTSPRTLADTVSAYAVSSDNQKIAAEDLLRCRSFVRLLRSSSQARSLFGGVYER